MSPSRVSEFLQDQMSVAESLDKNALLLLVSASVSSIWTSEQSLVTPYSFEAMTIPLQVVAMS